MDTIRECMRHPIIAIDEGASAQEAASLMGEKKISALLVKSGNDYSGIVTKTDLVTKLIAAGKDPRSTPVSELATKEVKTLDEYLSRGEANEFMNRHHIKHLVVTSQGKISGVVTVRDLVS